jgi:hypothetical protein
VSEFKEAMREEIEILSSANNNSLRNTFDEVFSLILEALLEEETQQTVSLVGLRNYLGDSLSPFDDFLRANRTLVKNNNHTQVMNPPSPSGIWCKFVILTILIHCLVWITYILNRTWDNVTRLFRSK